MAACVLLVVSLSLAPPVDSSTWQRTFVGLGYDVPAAVVLDAAGNAVVVGTGAGWLTTTERRARAFRVDSNGDLLWSRLLTLQLSAFTGLARLADGSMIAVGAAELTTGHVTGVVVRFDADGGVLWERRLDSSDTRSVYLDHIVLAPSGDLLIGGRFRRINDFQPVIVSMTPDGDVTWQLEIGLSAPNVGSPRLVATADGGFLCIGEGSLVASQGQDGLLVKFDSARQVEWQNAYGGTGIQQFQAGIERADGSFFVVGLDGPTTFDYEPWITSISSTGVMTSQWRLTGGGDTRAIAATPDGGAMVVGLWPPPYRGMLMKVDAAGALAWSTAHGGQDEMFFDLGIRSDGDAVVIGRTVRWELGDAWIMRADDRGLVASACWTVAQNAPSLTTSWPATPTAIPITIPALVVFEDAAVTLDPSPFVEESWCRPDEIQDVRVARLGGDAVLTWSPDPRASTYEVYRGTLTAFDGASYDHAAMGACDLPATTHSDGVILDGGDYYYLVVGRSASGRSPFGNASDGAIIPDASALCP